MRMTTYAERRADPFFPRLAQFCDMLPPSSGADKADYLLQLLNHEGYDIVPQQEEACGYAKAVALTRGPIPSVAAVAEALGDASPNGPEGNVWSLLDERYRTIQAGRRIPTGCAEAVREAVRTGDWRDVSDRDMKAWWGTLGNALVPGQPDTETEKAASWGSRLIGEILDDGWDRQEQAGVDVAAKEALARLRRDRSRMAFEDIDRNPPAAASHTDFLIATWVRSLGDAVEWCEVRLLPKRMVLAASVRGRPSREQEEELGRRLDMIRALRGVVGVSPGVRGLHSEDGVLTYEVEVRFDFFISTIGCSYAPLDLPAKPKAAA